MKHNTFRLLIVTMLLISLLLPACGKAANTNAQTGNVQAVQSSNQTTTPNSAAPEDVKPISIERLTDVNAPTREVLSADAARRLDVQTAMVSRDATQKMTIPIAALLYDEQGNTWVYTNPEPLTYVRNRVVVDHIDGNTVYLSSDLSEGTVVVTVGAEELYGAEFEFSEE